MTAGAERAQAVHLLHGVVVGRRTTDELMGEHSIPPLTRELVQGTLRHYFSLDAAVSRQLHRPMKPKDQDVRLLMMVGAYQLQHLRVPDHAAIFETVEACGALGKPWARGLVNAVLRRCAREPESGHVDHPAWLEALLRRQYRDADAIMAANNRRAPMALRINVARTAPADYVARLTGAGIASRPPRASEADPNRLLGPETRILDTACPVEALPGYREGLVSVQDAGAQFAAGLLAPGPGERVLDACAAPGGKLFHLVESHSQARVTALERSPSRLTHLEQEARRLGHPVMMLQGDATNTDWWDGEPYRRVLVDAPCSGTGTLRRHPDIKVLRRPDELETFARLQSHLLSSLWRVLEPGGTLVYCTCSILTAENDDVIARFLARQPDAACAPLALPTGRVTRHGWQLLPTDDDTDGFYYARMIKAGA